MRVTICMYCTRFTKSLVTKKIYRGGCMSVMNLLNSVFNRSQMAMIPMKHFFNRMVLKGIRQTHCFPSNGAERGFDRLTAFPRDAAAANTPRSSTCAWICKQEGRHHKYAHSRQADWFRMNRMPTFLFQWILHRSSKFALTFARQKNSGKIAHQPSEYYTGHKETADKAKKIVEIRKLLIK